MKYQVVEVLDQEEDIRLVIETFPTLEEAYKLLNSLERHDYDREDKYGRKDITVYKIVKVDENDDFISIIDDDGNEIYE